MIQETDRKNYQVLATELLLMGLVRSPAETKLLGEGEIRPRFIKPTDGHFFNINVNSDVETARVILEERQTRDLKKRVTNSDPVVTVNGEPQIDFSEYNSHAQAEWEATHRSFKLAKECNLIFWISAEDGKVYSDGRFNIYFRSKEGKEISLKGKHMPLEIDRFKSLELGRRLIEAGGKTLGKMETVEDLRVQPIGFNLENMEEWIEECRRMMPEFEEFWTMFEKGDDLKQEAEVVKLVQEVKVMAKGDNVMFQMEMARRGYEINESGNHGSGYLGGRNQGVYNFKIEMRGGQYYAEKVKVNGKYICPICGEEVGEGEEVCGKCGVRMK